ncbi:MAG TPA: lysoplasmalogenase [Gammaproteobacteria bacterium]|nr:lysoplasmalogenase [Xanthomonadales bacterium]HOP23530.1 lysoplasmalogenase [Gammaproteobacteria bacterium]MCB1595157.1 lysoplasmalogenase [Xanthomonadales bacterium]MCB1604318.1 lysoplasmalogenase [Xanthomonadales bacterium]HPI96224.1 lysoplasmalogenase [Gammaproteobacteria bacterium]
MAIYIFPVLCLLACGISIRSEVNNQANLMLMFKFIASLAFVGLALYLAAFNSDYGKWLFIGLIFSLFGDVLLGLKGKKLWFLLGIGAFLLAHVFYAIAFYRTGFTSSRLALISPILVAFLILVLIWLKNHLAGVFKIAVPMYLLAIGAMLLFAWSGGEINYWIVSGATLFAISDLFVARNRFVKAESINRIIGLPIYYIAQLMLAYSISEIAV